MRMALTVIEAMAMEILKATLSLVAQALYRKGLVEVA